MSDTMPSADYRKAVNKLISLTEHHDIVVGIEGRSLLVSPPMSGATVYATGNKESILKLASLIGDAGVDEPREVIGRGYILGINLTMDFDPLPREPSVPELERINELKDKVRLVEEFAGSLFDSEYDMRDAEGISVSDDVRRRAVYEFFGFDSEKADAEHKQVNAFLRDYTAWTKRQERYS